MTNPYYADDLVTLYLGDCLDVLAAMPDASVDAVVTDPPYGLEFMGKAWDSFGGDRNEGARGGTGDLGILPGYGRGGSSEDRFKFRQKSSAAFGDWCGQWAAECLRVLKPGGHMLAFGGSRTWHRLAAAIEDAGFEIRDSIFWIYGSGFPKSLDVSKAIDKAAGAEREVVGHQPIGRATGHMRYGGENARPWQEAAIAEGHGGNITGAPATPDAARWQGWGTALKPAAEPVVCARKPLAAGTVAGNVLTYGTGALNIDACRTGLTADEDVDKLNARSGGRRGFADSYVGGDGTTRPFTPGADLSKGRWPTNVVLDGHAADALDAQSGPAGSNSMQRGTATKGMFGQLVSNVSHDTRADGGGASRFFPTFRYEPKAPTFERPTGADGTAHPTVKPLDLMRWLVRLVTPRGGVVLDPFLGSGTTAEACVHEGFRCIGIEREAAYLPLAVQRLARPVQGGFDFGEETA